MTQIHKYTKIRKILFVCHPYLDIGKKNREETFKDETDEI